MTLKLFTLNKHRHTPDAFEKVVQDFLSTSNDVIGFKAFENPHSGDVVFGFELSDARTVETEITVCAWLDMNQVEELTNNLCARIQEQGKRVRFVKIVPLSKSPRVLLAVLVEGSGSGSDNGRQQGQTEKQDTRTNEVADGGTKRSRVRRNRKDTSDGTT